MADQFMVCQRIYIIDHMKKQHYLPVLVFIAVLLSACTSNNALSIRELHNALQQATPGDTLVIANGTYTDVQLRLFAKGTKENPIVVCAQEHGRVYIEGKSNLQLAGEHLVVSGLYFRNGHSDRSVIEYRMDNEVANHCRVTACVIESFNPENRSDRNAWVVLYGRHNRFDHNTLIGKLNAEATLIVQLNEERNQENHHLIDHNLFGSRPNYGSNGAETIRVGNSTYSLVPSHTQIINNWFEHCDGEVEHVSIKSCDNLIARNVFYECAGELVLRHGNRNTVEENVIIGNGKPHTGGIRIVNADQVVRNNYLEGLTGKRFFAALAVMNAVPNPLPNRYHQVENARIENNTFVRCEHIELGVGADFERTVPPANSIIKDNLFCYPEKDRIFEVHTDISGITFEGNKTVSSVPRPIYPVSKKNCGASWYIPHEEDTTQTQPVHRIEVEPQQNSLLKALAQAERGDTLLLVNGETYLISESALIEKPIVIKAKDTQKENPIIRYNGTKGGQAMLIIRDGGMPTLLGLTFDGAPYDGKAQANAGISPAQKMRGTYSAYMKGCVFKHFEASTFAGFKALKNSFADELVFEECSFHDISGQGIDLSAEKNDDGKYSAEQITIRQCEFKKILNASVNIYRGGNDESTTGPSLLMKNCKFEDCSNQERGAALRLIGVQTARLNELSFVNSGRGGAAIKFDECRWDDIQLSDITYKNSGSLRMNKLY